MLTRSHRWTLIGLMYLAIGVLIVALSASLPQRATN